MAPDQIPAIKNDVGIIRVSKLSKARREILQKPKKSRLKNLLPAKVFRLKNSSSSWSPPARNSNLCPIS